jgi:hypothetical protein
METQTLLGVFRGSERILVVLAASLCVWLGYRLFQSLPAEHNAQGKFELPGAKLTMSKVGPGVFFALFGALVLWQAQVHAFETTAKTASGETKIGYFAANDPQAAINVQSDIAVLNCMAQTAPAGIGRREMDATLHKARVALLRTAWQSSWSAADGEALQRGEVPDGPIATIYHARQSTCLVSEGVKQ